MWGHCNAIPKSWVHFIIDFVQLRQCLLCHNDNYNNNHFDSYHNMLQWQKPGYQQFPWLFPSSSEVFHTGPLLGWNGNLIWLHPVKSSVLIASSKIQFLWWKGLHKYQRQNHLNKHKFTSNYLTWNFDLFNSKAFTPSYLLCSMCQRRKSGNIFSQNAIDGTIWSMRSILFQKPVVHTSELQVLCADIKGKHQGTISLIIHTLTKSWKKI